MIYERKIKIFVSDLPRGINYYKYFVININVIKNFLYNKIKFITIPQGEDIRISNLNYVGGKYENKSGE